MEQSSRPLGDKVEPMDTWSYVVRLFPLLQTPTKAKQVQEAFGGARIQAGALSHYKRCINRAL